MTKACLKDSQEELNIKHNNEAKCSFEQLSSIFLFSTYKTSVDVYYMDKCC